MKATILIAIVLAGSGTALVAEQALPGDALYSVKVGVNERVKGWFAVNAQAEADLQVQLLEERVNEIEALLAEDRLTADAAVKAGAALSAQITETIRATGAVTATMSAETRARLSAIFVGLGEVRTKLGALRGEGSATAAARTGGGVPVAASAELDELTASIDAALEAGAEIDLDASEDDSMDDTEEDMMDDSDTMDDGDMSDDSRDTGTSTIDVDLDATTTSPVGTTTVETETTI